VSQRGFETPVPAISRHIHYYSTNTTLINGVGHKSESQQLQLLGGGHLFNSFLLQRMTPTTADYRIRYATSYGHILQSGDASELLQLMPDKRIHAMKSLSCLAQYSGKQDIWLAVSRHYNLQWSTGTD
jgi:hypothetical protein